MINGNEAGTFKYEIISPITNRRKLTNGSITKIRKELPENSLFEDNSIFYARKFAPIDDSIADILKTIEALIYLADRLEKDHTKEDYKYW